MAPTTSFPLLDANGEVLGSIPAIGFGTFQPDPTTPPGTVKAAVLEAIRNGYRHIDTAYSYSMGKVEVEVGQAIRECGIPREELFVVTKLHNPFHSPEDVRVGFEWSLRNLGLDYVDLFLIHFPHAYVPLPETYDTLRKPNGKPVIDYDLSRRYTDTYKAMEELVHEGRTKFIGLSNFSILKTKRILEVASIHPVVNQVELHPYLPQRRLLEFSKAHNIHLTAHSPLGGAPVAAVASDEPGPLIDETILSLAQKHNISPAQILLSWGLQRGTSVIPKSNNPARIAANYAAVEFELDEQDMAAIDGLRGEEDSSRMNDPRRHVGFDIYNEEADEPTVEQGVGRA
ncbi:NADP-dependent oxidoreductase domain-containing protein [Peziza echinospora]|nr:NADP-dependent oxidoreductase domain-containing protein [Peziza echinospora]